MRYLRIGLIAFWGFIQSPLMGQGGLPIGAWRSHFSYMDAQKVIEIEGVYYVLSSGGLYKYDLSNQSVGKLGSVEGFRTSPISTIGLFGKNLGIGYENGLIDIVGKDGSITVFRDVYESEFSSKTINEIRSFNGKVMVSTDFGLILVNPITQRVIESYWQFDESGNEYKILSSVEHQQVFYLIGEGLLLSGLNDGSVNLLDYNSWVMNNSFNQPELIESSGDVLLLASRQEGLFSFDNGNWQLQGLELHSFRSMNVENSLFLISTDLGPYTYDGDILSPQSVPPDVEKVNQFSKSEKLDYYATEKRGLVIVSSNGQESIFPEGPSVNDIWQMKTLNNRIALVQGAYSASYLPLGNEANWSVFDDNQWQSFNRDNTSLWNDLTDISSIELFQDHLYLSSFNMGVWKYNETAGSLEKLMPPPEIDISDVTKLMTDEDGLWMISISNNLPLVHLSHTGEFQAYFTNTSYPHHIVEIASNDINIFILINNASNKYILAIEKSSGLLRKLSTNNEEGNLPGNPVSMTTDVQGNLWVGTTNGVAYIPKFNVAKNDISAIRPIIGNDYVFSGEQVDVLLFDAGNQLWIGTDQGLWLVDNNIDFQLEYLHAGNTPLISNKIVSLAMNHDTGELFILTDKGLFSYGARAVSAGVNFKNVKIYPNPVEPDFHGEVGIKGLIQSSNVRITTASGYLVWQGVSTGGMATWDLRDLTGKRVESGVYFVFSANENGEEVFSGKILVIR